MTEEHKSDAAVIAEVHAAMQDENETARFDQVLGSIVHILLGNAPEFADRMNTLYLVWGRAKGVSEVEAVSEGHTINLMSAVANVLGAEFAGVDEVYRPKPSGTVQ